MFFFCKGFFRLYELSIKEFLMTSNSNYLKWNRLKALMQAEVFYSVSFVIVFWEDFSIYRANICKQDKGLDLPILHKGKKFNRTNFISPVRQIPKLVLQYSSLLLVCNKYNCKVCIALFFLSFFQTIYTKIISVNISFNIWTFVCTFLWYVHV